MTHRVGWIDIECFVEDIDASEAKMWEIVENLHRAELTALERDEQVALWVELSEKKLVQPEPVSKGGRGNEEGIRRAAREEHRRRKTNRHPYRFLLAFLAIV